MLVTSLEGNFTNRSLGKDVPISREVTVIRFNLRMCDQWDLEHVTNSFSYTSADFQRP